MFIDPRGLYLLYSAEFIVNLKDSGRCPFQSGRSRASSSTFAMKKGGRFSSHGQASSEMSLTKRIEGLCLVLASSTATQFTPGAEHIAAAGPGRTKLIEVTWGRPSNAADTPQPAVLGLRVLKCGLECNRLPWQTAAVVVRLARDGVVEELGE